MKNDGLYFNEEAEKCVLGSLLLDWKKMAVVEGELKTEDFNVFYNQTVFSVMKDMFSKGISCDLVTLVDELNKTNLLNKAGGVSYITSLTDIVPSSSNIEYYVKIIKRCRINRDLLKLSQLTQESLNKREDNEAIIEQLEKTVLEISFRNSASKIFDSASLMKTGVEEIQKRKDNFGTVYGVPTGFTKLDQMFSGGFQNGEYYVIGARPSIGKTALALSMMESMIKNGYSVGFISLEMTARQLSFRLLSQMTGIAGTRFQSGQINDSNMDSVKKAAGEIVSKNLYITESYNATINEVRSLTRYLVYMKKIDIVFIDYIGLIRVEDDSQYWQKVSSVSKSLFHLSHELDIPVVALCQLNNDAEEKEPSLTNIRGSSDIANDADNVVFIHGLRDIPHDDCEYEDTPDIDRVLLVEKNRQGPLGRVDLKFHKRLTKFVSA